MKEFNYIEYEIKLNELLIQKGYDTASIIKNISRVKNVDGNTGSTLNVKLFETIYGSENNPFDLSQTVERLILNGANVNAVEQEKGNTPLMAAVTKEQYEIFCKLIQYGANINTVNFYASTPLMWSARKNNILMLTDLIMLGADINAVCKDGDSALTSAVRHGNIACFNRLIEAGAIYNINTISNYNLLTVANSISQSRFPNRIKMIEEVKKYVTTDSSFENVQLQNTEDTIKKELVLAKRKLQTMTDLNSEDEGRFPF